MLFDWEAGSSLQEVTLPAAPAPKQTVRQQHQTIAPGVPGRVEAMRQTRDGQGRFAARLPVPLNDAEIQDLAERRRKAHETGRGFRPTQEEWKLIQKEAWYMWLSDPRPQIIAAALDISESSVRRAIAAAASSLADTRTEQHSTLEWAGATYVSIIERALEANDLEGARKATSDLLRARGLMPTTGTNVGIQLNLKSEDEVSAEVREWTARYDAEAHPLVGEASPN